MFSCSDVFKTWSHGWNALSVLVDYKQLTSQTKVGSVFKGELAASISFLFDGISGKPSKNYEFQKKIKSVAQVVRELFNF